MFIEEILENYLKNIFCFFKKPLKDTFEKPWFLSKEYLKNIDFTKNILKNFGQRNGEKDSLKSVTFVWEGQCEVIITLGQYIEP